MEWPKRGWLVGRPEFIQYAYIRFNLPIRGWPRTPSLCDRLPRRSAQALGDRLTLEGKDAYIENYRRGSMALILNCNLPVVEFPESNRTRFIHEDRLDGNNRSVFLILKANTVENHRLQSWDEKLMFVHDVQIVKSPEQWIPSRVGIYVSKKERVAFVICFSFRALLRGAISFSLVSLNGNRVHLVLNSVGTSS